MRTDFSEVTPEILDLSELCKNNSSIDPDLYAKYEVKRGLRDLNGKGVLAGLTEVSEIQSTIVKDGVETPCEGKLYYRGYDVEKLVEG
ncbi:MAG: citrate synthase, partial [Oscillospiraceae bacterium]